MLKYLQNDSKFPAAFLIFLEKFNISNKYCYSNIDLKKQKYDFSEIYVRKEAIQTS